MAPEAICAHVVEVIRPELEAKRKAPLSPEQVKTATAACVEGERAEQAEGDEHWRCRSKCLVAAKSGEQAMACDDSCALPPIPLDCDAALKPSELGTELGVTVTLEPDSGKGTDTQVTCTRDYVADRLPGLLSIAVHRTRVDASTAVKEQDKNARGLVAVPSLGDAAVHYETPFEKVPLCHVRAAKGRVSIQLSVAQKKCAFDKLERTAAKVLSRLP
jgi:hypothetical protein